MSFPFRAYVLEEDWFCQPFNVSVNASIGGYRQEIATFADTWKADLSVRIAQSDLSPLRAWMTRRRGRLISDKMGPRREWAGKGWPETTFSDDATFGDGSSFAAGASVVSAIALRATEGSFRSAGTADGWTLGRFFGLGGRLYQITETISVADDVARVAFWPPLRAAADAGVATDWPPRSPMILASNDPQPVRDEASGKIDISIQLEEVSP